MIKPLNKLIPRMPNKRKKKELSITRLKMLGSALIKEFMVIFNPSLLEINLKGLKILVSLKVFIMLIFWFDMPNDEIEAPITIKKSNIFQAFLK